jgi:hypothetical protein
LFGGRENVWPNSIMDSNLQDNNNVCASEKEENQSNMTLVEKISLISTSGTPICCISNRDFSTVYLECKAEELCFKREQLDFDIQDKAKEVESKEGSLVMQERTMEMQEKKDKEAMKCSIS